MFPSILDTFSRPTPTDRLNNPSHSALHNTVSSALGQIQAVIGLNTGPNASAVGTLMNDIHSPDSNGGGHVQTANKGGTGQTQYTMLQPFSIITSCVLSQSPGVSVSIGSGNGIGLPYYLTNISNIVSMTSGATVTPANNLRVTNTTATTSPTRGFITPSSAPNGTTLLNICYYVY